MRQTITDAQDIGPLDLRAQAQELDAAGVGWECIREQDEDRGPEAITVLYCAERGRAGIAWGADASWTDATGVDDAVRRFWADDLAE